MYTVIGTGRSRTLRVLWMLEELGVPFRHVPAMPQAAEVRAVNPAGKVPVLMVDGLAVPDSTAILTYLADRHGAFSFAAGTTERLRQDSLTQLVLDELDAALWLAARHSFILPEERRVPAVKDTLRWELPQAMARVAARLGEGPFVMGEAMTVPDIVLAHCLLWAGLARFEVTEPVLADHLAMMRARPAFQRAAAR